MEEEEEEEVYVLMSELIIDEDEGESTRECIMKLIR